VRASAASNTSSCWKPTRAKPRSSTGPSSGWTACAF
jgi:hypothetical protein